jgi:hypothetical protein
MSELTDKFHDGMTVKLRCGGVLEGITYAECEFHFESHELAWHNDGTYSDFEGEEHPLDIVEVLSKKPQHQLTLEECLNRGNLCGGMMFTRTDGGRNNFTVYAFNGEYYVAFDNDRTVLYRVDTMRNMQAWILSED